MNTINTLRIMTFPDKCAGKADNIQVNKHFKVVHDAVNTHYAYTNKKHIYTINRGVNSFV